MSDFKKTLGQQYAFLDEDKRLGDNIHLLVYGGSKAYGTNLPDSDVDIRGIATNSAEAILTRQDFDTVVDEETDTVIYSLDKILELLMNCNPNTIEILFTRDEDIIYIDEIGKLLRNNRQLFLSKRCINTFGGYANQQLYRLQQKTLAALPQKEYNQHIADVISKMKEHLYKHYGIDTIEVTNSDNGLVAEIKETRCPADKLADILNEITNVIRTYNKNSQRNKKAIEHKKINKHAMHLLRLYKMATELLSTGSTSTYRTKEHELLMSIRNGEYSNSDGELKQDFFELVKQEEERFEKAKFSNILPDQPNITKIRQLQMEINKTVIKSENRKK